MTWVADQEPDRVAMVYEGEQSTRAAFERRANRLARA